LQSIRVTSKNDDVNTVFFGLLAKRANYIVCLETLAFKDRYCECTDKLPYAIKLGT
tara:strand:- start:377 stop:544 length:168 start_codon:yes stop_codon:yes gene_type:complete